MPNLCVFGAQWGDEGKGKVVDYYAASCELVVRFAGGANAGHTLVLGERRLAVHLLPSGIVREGAICVLGDGMVIDLAALIAEMDQLAAAGFDVGAHRLRIGSRAHLVLPFHRQLDELREGRANALGTTKRGIGPAYEDKAARRGIRACDLLHPPRLRQRLGAAYDEAAARIARMGGQPAACDEILAELAAQAERLAPHIVELSGFLERELRLGKRALFEGAQGVLLDLDHGTYPFVTSSGTVPAAACLSAGVAPEALGARVGVSKAYTTRVGSGPFPSELTDELAERLRAAGGEYGATTGRPRRCGWLDLPALRYAARVSGMQWLALTKLDVLAGLERLSICERYRLGDRVLDDFPDDPDDLAAVVPVLREVRGFAALPPDPQALEDLPQAAREYVQLVEREVGVPVCLVSVGADRAATIERHALAGG